MKQHYTTLGLQEGASQEEIEGAYKRLSKELNPANNDNQEFFKEEYKNLQTAYKALSASSILATKGGAKNTAVAPQKTKKDKTTAMTPKKKKITKKTKLLLAILAGIFAIGLGIYMFSENQSKFSKLDGLVYESQSTRWMQSYISNNIVYEKDNMKPFSGKLSNIIEYYDGRFLNGKKNGLHKEYYYGALVREGRFENGTPIGIHKNWHKNGQLKMEVTFSKGKRVGFSKKWNEDGDLISLDFDQNKILDYMTNYLNSSKTLNIVEGSYDDYYKNQKGYNFSIIKIFDRYYAIMTNNFRNGTQDSNPKAKTFYIGDVKAIFSSTQETNKFAGWYFMSDNSKEHVTLNYNIIGNSLDFNVDTPGSPFTYYKK